MGTGRDRGALRSRGHTWLTAAHGVESPQQLMQAAPWSFETHILNLHEVERTVPAPLPSVQRPSLDAQPGHHLMSGGARCPGSDKWAPGPWGLSKHCSEWVPIASGAVGPSATAPRAPRPSLKVGMGLLDSWGLGFPDLDQLILRDGSSPRYPWWLVAHANVANHGYSCLCGRWPPSRALCCDHAWPPFLIVNVQTSTIIWDFTNPCDL